MERRRAGSRLASCRPNSMGSTSPLLLDRLDLDRDRYLVTDQYPSGLQRLIPQHAEILAIDLGGCRCPGAGLAGGILDRCGALDLEDDRLGHAVQREIAGDLTFVGSVRLDL